MWPISSLGNARLVAEVNPVYHLIEITRAPLLGEYAGLHSWLAAIGLAIVGSVLGSRADGAGVAAHRLLALI